MNLQTIGAAIGSAHGKKIDLNPMRITNISDSEDMELSYVDPMEINPTLKYRLSEEDMWEDFIIGNTYTIPVGGYMEFQATEDLKDLTGYDGEIEGHFEISGGSAALSGNLLSLCYAELNELNIQDIPESENSDSVFGGLFCECLPLVKISKNFLSAINLTGDCYAALFKETGIKNAPELPATTLEQHCYDNMFFGCTSLTSAPELPATILANACYGNMFFGCTSLTSAPTLPATTLSQNCYSSMFENCTGLTASPVLPATTLEQYCYASMFAGCTSLTSAPTLPATTLVAACYNNMFSGCTSLTSAPELPATTLKTTCYAFMFADCASLTSAPELPATTLEQYCYDSMFSGCTSLISAPTMPATTLKASCYQNMFKGCTSLTAAPELPATTLARDCYLAIFYNCTSLSAMKCLATDISEIDCTKDWLYGVSPSGTFTKAAAMSGWTTGADGIPSGWTVQDA